MGRDLSGASRHLSVTWPRLRQNSTSNVLYSACIHACQRRSLTATDSHVLALRGRTTGCSALLHHVGSATACNLSRPKARPAAAGTRRAGCGLRESMAGAPAGSSRCTLAAHHPPRELGPKRSPANHRPRPRGPSCIDAAVLPWLAAETGRPRASSGALDRPIEAPSSPVANS